MTNANNRIVERFKKCYSHRFAAGRIRPVCGPVAGPIGRAGNALPAARGIHNDWRARSDVPYLEPPRGPGLQRLRFCVTALVR
jgi:hypothetical protein